MPSTDTTSTYHSLLRISALTLAVTLVFVSGAIHPVTTQLSYDTSQYLANAVSVGAGVAPTELNQITAELTKQKIALEDREAAIAERELALGLQSRSVDEWNISATTINAVLLFIILVLMIINYGLDFRYRRKRAVYNTNAA